MLFGQLQILMYSSEDKCEEKLRNLGSQEQKFKKLYFEEMSKYLAIWAF